ncbi:MAG TPA: ATP-dependent DNA helicase RecG, partial [Myxococcota bacterium]|nr:ATP-dependent DNA helicase RecG [Myxococcota bacterium]
MTPERDPLESPIQYVKGVGPRLAERFAAHDIHTVGDALRFLPRRYEDRPLVASISALRPGEQAAFLAQVLDFGMRHAGRGRRIFELLLGDASGRILCRWFNFHPQSFARRFQRGARVRVAGLVELYRGQRQLVHPEVEPAPEEAGEADAASEALEAERLIPVYPEVEGVYPKALRRIQARVVDAYAAQARDVLPAWVRAAHGLPELAAALGAVHRPGPDADVELLNGFRSPGQRRLVFEEFFLLQLGLALRRERVRRQRAHGLCAGGDYAALAERLFGFALTPAQRRVLEELLRDLAAERPMNRLLQGDVGSGKTALAVLAAVAVSRAAGQTALMAPTEVLAEQHHRRIAELLRRGPDALETVLLTAAVKGDERRRAFEAIRSGRAGLVIGTQALLEEAVEFHRLGLCVIDEQHRFGVLQRARLRGKGLAPHVLVMTATPIPRTLAMTLYGDLDVSILDELPPGRQAVRTQVLRGGQVGQAYRAVRREVETGGQAYLIYPLVEASEKIDLRDATRMAEELAAGAFRGLRLGLLHGRMPAEEKDAVMRRFAAGELDVLVSTTVVEVGVDVARAGVMVIEHAERFGLSQLHQLRGGVGRGSRPGSCFLVAHELGSEDARARLKVMERTTDGFVIAEKDLAIRGPGEFLGTRQSGLPAFSVGNLA